MGCGASANSYEVQPKKEKTKKEKSAVDKLVASTTPNEKSLLDVDVDLIDKLWAVHDKKHRGAIPSTSLPLLLKQYAQARKEKIEKSMTGTIRINAEQIKATRVMDELEQRYEEFSANMLKALNLEGRSDEEVVQYDFDVEMTKLMESLTGEAHFGRRYSKDKRRSDSKEANSMEPSKMPGTFRSAFIDEFLLAQLWDMYDVNQDNVMQADEAAHLLESYATKYREKIEKAALTKRGNVVMSKEDRTMAEAMTHLQANVAVFAEQLLNLMDVDKNGEVDKEEFMEKFPYVWEKINQTCRREVAESRSKKGSTEKLP
mmetsp:Transcript_121798/g.191190  ORF Transcript_121798/g.191190 Transcript_121798/m.191190 type:complete len:316 (-) Transcript_121798:249-1196(-)